MWASQPLRNKRYSTDPENRSVNIGWIINNSVEYWPIALKFDMLVQYGSPDAVELLKSAFGQVQDGKRLDMFKW